MLGNLAYLVVTSFVSLGTLLTPSPKIVSPVPVIHQPAPRIKRATVDVKKQTKTIVILPSITPTPTILPTDTPLVTATPTVQPTQTPSLSLTPTVTIAPAPTISVVTTPTPTPSAPVDIEALFTDHANHYSVDKDLLKQIARCESSMNSSAVNGPYGGMYQFSESSWISTRTSMGMDTATSLRFDASEAIRTAAFKLSTGGRSAWPNC